MVTPFFILKEPDKRQLFISIQLKLGSTLADTTNGLWTLQMPLKSLKKQLLLKNSLRAKYRFQFVWIIHVISK